MPERSSKINSNADLIIVLIFLSSMLVTLTVGFWSGLFLVLAGLVYAINTEIDYETYHLEVRQYKYAGFWIRTGSLIVDSGLTFALIDLMFLVNKKYAFSENSNMWFVLSMTVLTLYMLKRWGQSPGKMAMGIKVVTADYQPIGWRHIFLRNLLDILQSLGYLTKVFLVAFGILDLNLKILGDSVLPPDTFKFMSDKFKNLMMFWTFSEILVLLTNDRRRALHDFLAGTVVIVEEKVTRYRWAWVTGAILCLIFFFLLIFTQGQYAFIERAEKGDAAAQRGIAQCYQVGMGGFSQDQGLAFQWYQKAANQGDAKSQNELAEIYEKGVGVPVNKAEAIRWYTLASKSGDWTEAKKASIALDLLGVKQK